MEIKKNVAANSNNKTMIENFFKIKLLKIGNEGMTYGTKRDE